jgi:sugar phosphate isomerase/epimerase
MKLGVYSISLPDLTPREAVSAARKLGYGGIEWRVAPRRDDLSHETPSYFGHNRCTLEPTVEAGAMARGLCVDEGIEVLGLSPYIGVGDVTAVEAAMRMAVAAGAPQVRLRAASTGEDSYAALFARTVDFLGAVEQLALRYGVRGVVEVHQRTICPSASLTHRLVSGFDPKAIGVIFDVGNMVIEGYEDHRIGLELLGAHLVHVHLKNVAYERPADGGVWTPRWAPIDDGVLDVPAFLRVLAETGYDGWIATEDFSTLRSPQETLAYNAAYLSDCWPRSPASDGRADE